MAEVYKNVNGEPIQRLIARTRPVQNQLDLSAWKILGRAIGILETHRQTGNAHLGKERGHIDRYVYMEDPPAASSPGAAMSIEYGHYLGPRGAKKRQWIPGIWPLHDAAGLPRKGR